MLPRKMGYPLRCLGTFSQAQGLCQSVLAASQSSCDSQCCSGPHDCQGRAEASCPQGLGTEFQGGLLPKDPPDMGNTMPLSGP